MILRSDDDNRVRTLTLNRPEALNAFNEALYEATAEALTVAADDPEIAVVLLTGAGRAFSAGNDLNEMQARITDPQMARQGSAEMPVHQPRGGAGSGVVVSAAAADGPAKRRLAVDVLRVGDRRRGAANGPGMEGV